MFVTIISAAMLGILAGFIGCMLCSKETYQEDLVEWGNLNEA